MRRHKAARIRQPRDAQGDETAGVGAGAHGHPANKGRDNNKNTKGVVNTNKSSPNSANEKLASKIIRKKKRMLYKKGRKRHLNVRIRI